MERIHSCEHTTCFTVFTLDTLRCFFFSRRIQSVYSLHFIQKVEFAGGTHKKGAIHTQSIERVFLICPLCHQPHCLLFTQPTRCQSCIKLLLMPSQRFILPLLHKESIQAELVFVTTVNCNYSSAMCLQSKTWLFLMAADLFFFFSF